MERLRNIGETCGIVLLPRTILSNTKGYDGKAALVDAGVLLHGPLEDYPQLCFAELPSGWKVVKHEKASLLNRHRLLDDKSRVRANIYHDYDFSGAISMRRVRVRAKMVVPCPFIFSFRKAAQGRIVARVRIRHGSELKAMPSISASRRIKNVEEVRAEQLAFLRQWVEEMCPKWRWSPKYWDLQPAA